MAVGGGVSEFEVAARATRGIPVAACAATGDVCDVESIVWVVGRAAVGGLQIDNEKIGSDVLGSTIDGVVGCANCEDCASPSAESLVGVDVLAAPT